MSYLDGSYLAAGEGYDAGDATVALYPALGEEPQGEEMILLPGGIALPKKTLLLILGAIAIAAVVIYMRNRKPATAARIED